MKTLKLIAASAAVLAANSAFSLTQVVHFEGTFDTNNIIAPEALKSQVEAQLTALLSSSSYTGGLGYEGYLYIRDYQNFYKRVKINGEKVFLTQSGEVDVSSNPDVGFTIMGKDLGGFEGQRLFFPDPDNDGGKLRFTDPQTPQFGNLLGNASFQVDEGKLGKFSWTIGREHLKSYDALLANNGANFQLKSISLVFGEDGYSFKDQILAENIVVNPNSAVLKIEVQEVPVPAAAWLFGSAMLGLAGVKKRK